MLFYGFYAWNKDIYIHTYIHTKVIGLRWRSQEHRSVSVYSVCGRSTFDWQAILLLLLVDKLNDHVWLYCYTDVNECDSSPCMNAGSCTDIINGYQCSCTAGFTGTRCQRGLYTYIRRLLLLLLLLKLFVTRKIPSRKPQMRCRAVRKCSCLYTMRDFNFRWAKPLSTFAQWKQPAKC